jgi:hypothetical protein
LNSPPINAAQFSFQQQMQQMQQFQQQQQQQAQYRQELQQAVQEQLQQSNLVVNLPSPLYGGSGGVHSGDNDEQDEYNEVEENDDQGAGMGEEEEVGKEEEEEYDNDVMDVVRDHMIIGDINTVNRISEPTMMPFQEQCFIKAHNYWSLPHHIPQPITTTTTTTVDPPNNRDVTGASNKGACFLHHHHQNKHAARLFSTSTVSTVRAPYDTQMDMFLDRIYIKRCFPEIPFEGEEV